MGMIKSRAAALAKTAAKAGGVRVPDDVFAAIGFDPRDVQRTILLQDKRFNVRVLHRRAGKTVMEIAKLIDRAVDNPLPQGRYAYCGPTYGQVKDIAWLYLMSFHEALCARCGINADDWRSASELWVEVPTRNGNRSRIRLYGLDSPKQRIRGLYLDGLVMDEWAWILPSAWTEQLRAMLADENRNVLDLSGRRNQWADFIFTPYGRNHAYKMLQKAEAWQKGQETIETDPVTGIEFRQKSDEWTAVNFKASETGIISKEELATIKADIGIAKYEQEFENSFDAAVVGAIYAADLAEARAQGRITVLPWLKHLPVHTAWDLGFNDATAIVFWQQVGNRMNFIDFYEASQADIEHYVDILADRGYRYGQMLFPHDVEQQFLAAGGVSAKSKLQQLGVRVTTVRKHRVTDRVTAVQTQLSRCSFDEERCRNLLDRLALYRRRYNEQDDIMSVEPVHDWTSHAADAFGYAIIGARKGGDDVPRHNPASAAV